jgi:hypothetical protein
MWRKYLGPFVQPKEAVVVKLAGGDGQRDFEARINVPAEPAKAYLSDGSTDTSGNGPNAYPNEVAMDSNGNVIFAGSFDNWMKLGTIQLTSDAVFEQYSMYNGYLSSNDTMTPTPGGSWICYERATGPKRELPRILPVR